MWSGNGLGGSVWEWELGDRRVRCLPEVWLQNSPNCIISALLQREYSVVLFSLSYWEILRVFLDWRWRSTHSGLLMRKALRTQKFSRHYSMTFVRFAWDAAARHSCSHGVATRQAPRGSTQGQGVTLGSLVMCATSKRIRLCPPPLISDPHCGLQGEHVEVMRPCCTSAPTATSTTRH